MTKSASVMLSSAILMLLSPVVIAQQGGAKPAANTHVVSDKGAMMRGSTDAAKKGSDINVAGK